VPRARKSRATPEGIAFRASFQALLAAYPCQDDPGAAAKELKKLIDAGVAIEPLIAAAERYAAERAADHRPDAARWTKKLHNWLRDWSFANEPKKPAGLAGFGSLDEFYAAAREQRSH
jgi:hypothetical protein